MDRGFGNTCKDCTDRVVGCHSTCEKYIKANSEFNAKKQALCDKKRKENLVRDSRAIQVDKALRRKGIKRGVR